MRHFGAQVSFEGNIVKVSPGAYQSAPFTVESDWSAASYWFAFTALASDASISLPKLSLTSLQGDSVIRKIMEPLGVDAVMENGLLKLTKRKHLSELSWDFTHCPDLAQTVAVVCAAKGIKGHFTGLESLRIKETDRIAALQQELKKIGGDLIEVDAEHWTLVPSQQLPARASFATYKDHRMAMAFAPLVTLMDVEIDKGDVVRKSYPNFWNDLKTVGINVTEA
jgi:3-phosphoshikimate 1-carboxyvinyltransferase